MRVLNIVDADTGDLIPFTTKNGKIIILSSGVHNAVEIVTIDEGVLVTRSKIDPLEHYC